MLCKLIENKVAKNAGWIIGGKIAQMIISFVVSILSARYLGPANYGLINYGAAYVSFFTALSTLGINSIIVKELINNRYNEGKVLGTALGLRAIASFLSVLMIISLVFIIDRNDSIAIKVVSICSLGLIISVADLFKYWFQSYLNSRVTAIVGFIGYIIISIYKIVLMATERNVFWFAFSTSLDYFFIGVALAFIYKKQNGQSLHFSWNYAKKMLHTSFHFILPSLMVAIYAQIDKIMIKHMLGEDEVGFYATAVALSNMWCFVLQAIIDSLIPSILEDHKENNIESYTRKNKLLYAIVFYISIVVSALYCLLSKQAIFMLYGEEYLPSYKPLCVITWYSAFSYLGVARNTWIVSEGKQRYLKYMYFSAAILNVFLNCCFIPHMGATGAALASLITQIFTSIILPAFFKEMRPNVRLMVDAILLKGIFKNK